MCSDFVAAAKGNQYKGNSSVGDEEAVRAGKGKEKKDRFKEKVLGVGGGKNQGRVFTCFSQEPRREHCTQAQISSTSALG